MHAANVSRATTLCRCTEALTNVANNPRYSHLLLDEAQDTSEAQFALLEALAPQAVPLERRTTITAVGDPDQTIYGFRGTRSDVLSRIATRFDCVPLALPTNYRCASAIVEMARAVIEGSAVRDEAPLLAARQAAAGQVRAFQFDGRNAELEFVCGELQAMQQRGELRSVAVLCRLRVQCAVLRKALMKRGVKTLTAAPRDGRNEHAPGPELVEVCHVVDPLPPPPLPSYRACPLPPPTPPPPPPPRRGCHVVDAAGGRPKG